MIAFYDYKKFSLNTLAGLVFSIFLKQWEM